MIVDNPNFPPNSSTYQNGVSLPVDVHVSGISGSDVQARDCSDTEGFVGITGSVQVVRPSSLLYKT